MGRRVWVAHGIFNRDIKQGSVYPGLKLSREIWATDGFGGLLENMCNFILWCLFAKNIGEEVRVKWANYTFFCGAGEAWKKLFDVVRKKKEKGWKFRKKTKRTEGESEKMSVAERENSFILMNWMRTVYSHVQDAADAERMNDCVTQNCARCYG